MAYRQARLVRFLPADGCPGRGKLLMALDGEVVSRIFASRNQLGGWLRAVEALRRVLSKPG